MKNMKHRMAEYHADREKENEYQRELTNYKKLGVYMLIGYAALCVGCALLSKEEKKTDSIQTTNTIDNLVK